jgi:hypothetical protein
VRVNLGDADATVGNALPVTDFLGERQSPSRDQDRHRCRGMGRVEWIDLCLPSSTTATVTC